MYQGGVYGATPPVSSQRTGGRDQHHKDADLVVSIRKATLPVESAPKRKHVRSCIVYTWDHQTSVPFWASLKTQPIFTDDVQAFKALILVHKVLQEGHEICLVDVQSQLSWFESCARSFSHNDSRGYGSLIQAYSKFLIHKIYFHRDHPEFNGTFDYDEYTSLRNANNPDKCYETVTEMQGLLEELDELQHLIFSSFIPGAANECRISALVPLVVESYGLYKFITGLIRALSATLDSEEILQLLKDKYVAQHKDLLKFYYECSTLRYLTGLISIPKLPQEPPIFDVDGEEMPPALPQRPAQTGTDARNRGSASNNVSAETTGYTEPESMNEFWNSQNSQLEQQRALERQQQEEMERQRQMALQQQMQFQEQQRQQELQQQMAQDQLAREQYQRQAQGRVADLEREILAMRGQYDRDQIMLEQYDNRVKALESEIMQIQQNTQQQMTSRDQLIESLQQQVNMWRSKYESLAKLYTQLRQEHLDQLSKFKQMQLKAQSAQESIDKRERMEKEMKSKNLELADLIRERDRARHDLDRLKASHRDESEKTRRDIMFQHESEAKELKERNTELSMALSRCNREIADMEEALRNKSKTLNDSEFRLQDRIKELEAALADKDGEIEIYKAGMDETLLQLNNLQVGEQAKSANLEEVADLLDTVLQTSLQRIDDAIYELESPMQGGNVHTSVEQTMACLERASAAATDFANAFNEHFAEDSSTGSLVPIITSNNVFTSAVGDILFNMKGLTQFLSSESDVREGVNMTMEIAERTQDFFSSLLSFRISKLSVDERTDLVIDKNIEVQTGIQKLSKLFESIVSQRLAHDLDSEKREIEDVVDDEFGKAAQAINAATARLMQMLSRDRSAVSARDRQVHEAILGAATAITQATERLIKASADSQAEIVSQGRGSSTRGEFYKKNNRWTEGLISAAKAVASATSLLIDTADGVLDGKSTLEHLIVASNNVASATAQLVSASRVKAVFGSRVHEQLEDASKSVGSACRALVKQVESILENEKASANDTIDYESLAPSEFKVRQMEQQVAILKYEQELSIARKRLGDMRRAAYRFEADV